MTHKYHYMLFPLVDVLRNNVTPVLLDPTKLLLLLTYRTM